MKTEQTHSFNVSYKNVSEVQRGLAVACFDEVQITAGSKVLDLGCGDGKITATMAEKFPLSKITGLDISSELIQLASQTYQLPNLEFICQDLRQLNVVGEFDYLFSFFALHWIENPEKLISYEKALRALKQGRKFYFIIPLESPSLLKARNEAIKLVSAFNGYEIPFVESNASVYFDIFTKLKAQLNIQETRLDETQYDLDLSDKPFKEFFSSFAPELRQCDVSAKEQVAYLDLVTAKMPRKANGNIDFDFRVVIFCGELENGV